MKRRTLLVFGPLAIGAPVGWAQTYPTKSIRIVVPFAPGGATDAIARAVAQKLTEMLGQPVVVENRGGAGGNVGAEVVARAPADGYTMLLAVNSFVVNPSLYPKLNFDPIRDFQPLTLVATVPNVLVARPGFPAKTVPELIALAKSKPDQITFGSAGSGGGSHLAGELFNSMAGVQLKHIPYRGITPALTDLVGGQIDVCFAVISPVYPLVKSGKLQPIAMASSKRSHLLPDLPTIAESGLKGFDVSSWFGLLLPANPPKDVLDKLQTALVKIVRDPALKQSFAGQGIELDASTPQEFANFMKADQALWAKIISANNITAE